MKVECIKSDPLETIEVGKVYYAEKGIFRLRVLIDDKDWISIPRKVFDEFFKVLEQ